MNKDLIELIEFQNGMSYVLSSTSFDTAIKTPCYQKYFDIEDELIIPMNPDNWYRSTYEFYLSYYMNLSIVKKDKINVGTNGPGVYLYSKMIQLLNGKLCRLNETIGVGDTVKEFIPIFIHSEKQIKKLYCRFQFSGWSSYLWHGHVWVPPTFYCRIGMGYLTTSENNVNDELIVENEKINTLTIIEDDNDKTYEITTDVDDGDTIDFLILSFVSPGYLKILEMRFEYE